jgi:gluconolactonase
VTRTEYNGSITVFIDHFEGKRLNSPKDIICRSDGSIWFTDRPFGISNDYEGDRSPPELPANVYRIDALTGKPTIAATDIKGPNGLAFSPDETTLYLVEGRETPRRLLAFEVRSDGAQLGERRVSQSRQWRAGWLSLRRRWQSLVRLGHRQCGARWRCRVFF